MCDSRRPLTQNEAAERLRDWIFDSTTIGGDARPLASLDEALAAERASERAATVERIREATKDINVWPITLDRILDEVAQS